MIKLTITKAELVRAVERVGRAIQRKGHNPLAGTVKITAVKSDDWESVEFYSTDGLAFSGTSAAAKIALGGTVVVNVLHLERIISVLPEGDIGFVENEKTLSIVSGKKRFRIPILAVPYPREVEAATTNEMTLPSSMVLEALRRVEVCRDTGERPQLQGVLLEADGADLASCAVSGSRAALSKQPLPDGYHLHFGWCCFIPDSMFRSVHDLCEESEEVTFSHDTAVFVVSDRSMVGCQLPMTPFPPHEYPFNERAAPSCVVRTAQLIDALKSVSVASSDAAVTIMFRIDGNYLELRSLPSKADLEEPTESTDAIEIVHLQGPLSPSREFMLAANLTREVLRGFGSEVLISYTDNYARFDSYGGDDSASREQGTVSAIVMYRIH
jgi:DNA polymerase III sliding clamp (beta) subunit (PCNA family)